MEMTAKVLADLCKQHDLYRTARLNDKLYANFQGFTRIANLEAYTGLKALFLEGNALTSLEGLPSLPELKCLYVHQNRLTRMGDLAHLAALHTLNVSNNEIRELSGLGGTALETLICCHNLLTDADSIRNLLEVPTLQTVDLQHNKIDDEAAVDILRQLPNIRCLYLKGNPVVSKIRNYRKSLVAAIPTLTYLDDRPVFDTEREIVEGWAKDGVAGERAARDSIKQREREKDRRNFEFMQAIRAEAYREKREKMGLPPGDTDPKLDAFSDDEWEFEEDPPELVEARKKLEEYLAAQQSGEDAGSANSMAEDGEAYLGALRSNQAELGVSAGVAGLDASHFRSGVAQSVSQLNAVCTSEVQGMPALESLPVRVVGGCALHDLD